MTVELSLVIPAKNEARRLPAYLTTVQRYLRRADLEGHEVIVVDDGSIDGLADSVAHLASGWPELVLLRHVASRGKGAAIRTGFMAAQGRYLLFADADGATPIDEELRLRHAIDAGADLAVGSRLMTGHAVRCHRAWSRRAAGWVFARLVHSMFPISVQDTQCGFKMFRKEVGKCLSEASTEDGYLFDIQALALAERWKLKVVELPVRWRDVPGSKVNLIRDAYSMALGIRRVRRKMSLRRRGAAQHSFKSDEFCEPKDSINALTND